MPRVPRCQVRRPLISVLPPLQWVPLRDVVRPQRMAAGADRDEATRRERQRREKMGKSSLEDEDD